MPISSVLFYGFDSAQIKKLRPLCSRLSLRLRRVLPEEVCQPVGAMAGVGPLCDPAPEPVALPGKMLVFVQASDKQIDAFLSGLHTLRIGTDALKAVLTNTNLQWPGDRLYRELEKEHLELEEQKNEQ